MRKADWRDHWIFTFFDSLLLLGAALSLIGYLHLGWMGLAGIALTVVSVIIGFRVFTKQKTIGSS